MHLHFLLQLAQQLGTAVNIWQAVALPAYWSLRTPVTPLQRPRSAIQGKLGQTSWAGWVGCPQSRVVRPCQAQKRQELRQVPGVKSISSKRQNTGKVHGAAGLGDGKGWALPAQPSLEPSSSPHSSRRARYGLSSHPPRLAHALGAVLCPR